jgi:hypothetical protein
MAEKGENPFLVDNNFIHPGVEFFRKSKPLD